ncbi:MAG: hypothetical protein WD598_06205 [Acidimicrobiia bacterium]
MRRLVIGSALIASLLGVPAAPAAAETTAAPNDNVVTITVPVDVVGAKGKTSPDGTMSLVDYWEAILNQTWGAAFATIPYKDCYFLKLKLELTERGNDFDSTKGRHRILIGAPSGGLTFDGTGFNNVPETSRSKTTGDGTRSLEHDRDGAIPVDAPPTVVAHEFGHLFGLGDDRAKGAPKAGRDIDTVMVGNVPGVDLTKTARVDKNLIDRIGKIIERHLKDQGKKLPECQPWTGTVSATFSDAYPCSGADEGTITVGVVGKNASGIVAVSGSFTCGDFGILGSYSASGSATFGVTGTFTDAKFQFRPEPDLVTTGDGPTAQCAAIPERPIVVPVERGTATASFEWTSPGRQATCDITLERGEAVG